MSLFDYEKELRAREAEHKAWKIADAPLRAKRLTPETVTYWTDVIVRAQKLVTEGKSPCDYNPWRQAIHKVTSDTPFAVQYPYDTASKSDDHTFSKLMSIAEDIAQPNWPEPRRDLIEFALTFIEADVMLFRSGYCKRHLMARLRQAQLTQSDIKRVDAILRHSVIKGTGLEEYRVYCKMAAQLVYSGHLTDLKLWLHQKAQGAILTVDTMPTKMLLDRINNPRMRDIDVGNFLAHSIESDPKWGMAYPQLDQVIPIDYPLTLKEGKTARNAFTMLYAIQLRLDSQPKR